MDNLSSELHKLKIDKSKRGSPAPQSNRRGLIAVIVVLAIAGIAAVFAFRSSASVVLVDTIQPRLESSGPAAVLVATGYVVPHHKIQVGAKIMGRVEWIGVDKGDRVAADQVVVRLEDREYRARFDEAQATHRAALANLKELESGSRPEEIERARAEMDRAAAQLRTDEANFKRIEELVSQGVSPAQSLDEARGRFDTARANLASVTKSYELIHQGPRQEQIDSARAEVSRAQAAMEYARTILDATEIRAPSAGTILERNVERGEMVTTSFVGDRGAKSFVVTIADLTDIQVELDINQNDFNRITPSQLCTVTTDAFPDRVYSCQVDEIAPEANRQKATVQVKVKFLDPDEFIRPEMNARVTFLENAAAESVSATVKRFILPKRAVLERESGTAVLVVSDGMVQSKPISVDRELGSDVFVSSGLIGTEAIIVGDLLATLKVGDRVEARN